MFYQNSDRDLQTIYDQLKGRYELVLTNTAAVDERFTEDFPILVGKAHGQTIWLYLDCEMFVMDVMDAEQTRGTHWHPTDVDCAIHDIAKFMDGKSDYELIPFKKEQLL